jgi:hypothetical protein
MAHEQPIPDRQFTANGPSATVDGSMPRLIIAASAALVAVAAIGLGLPYPAEARFVLVVFALAIVGWTLLEIDDTVVALAAVIALLAGGALPLAAGPKTLTNPLIGLLLGAFVISAALRRSGLAERAVIATIGNARSVTRLFHGLALAILATAFVVPSTECKSRDGLSMHLNSPEASRSRPACTNVDLLSPVSVPQAPFCGPMKGRRLNLGESPAHRAAARIRPFLHDISSSCASDLLREKVGRRVVPENAPRIEIRIVDAQRRSVPISGPGKLPDASASVLQARDHPDILDGAALQDPTGVNLAATGVRRPVLAYRGDIELPLPDQPRKQLQLRPALRVGGIGVEHVGE